MAEREPYRFPGSLELVQRSAEALQARGPLPPLPPLGKHPGEGEWEVIGADRPLPKLRGL